MKESRTINRGKVVEDYTIMRHKTDPLFDKADELTIAISKCQKILAKYIEPESGISDRDAINDLLGVLDNKKLVILMRDLCSVAAK